MRVRRLVAMLFIPVVFLAVTAVAEGPTAAFTADAVSGVGALSVWFTDTSTPGTSPITAWEWDFGDGSEDDPFAAVPDPVHHYETPGSYTVSLTVTTAEGTDTITQSNLVMVLGLSVFRVDSSNTSGTEDGLSWATAFTTIQEGVEAAFWASGGEVWVARGTYTDNINAGLADSNPGDDYCVVWMRNNVALFGGFSGLENNREERDPVSNPVIINGENIRRCIVASADSPLTLDGFTLQNGHAAGNPAEGGGMYASLVPSLGVRRCLFTGNTAVGDDGNSSAQNGKAGNGGALAVMGGRIYLSAVTFTDNEAIGGDGYYSGFAGAGGAASGGALFVSNAILAALDTDANGNTAGGGKGANRFNASAGMGGVAGGGGLSLDTSFALLLQCTFTNNTSQGGWGGTCTSPSEGTGGAGGAADGGGIYNTTSGLWMQDTALESNTVLGGQGGSGILAGGVGGAGHGGGMYDEGTALSFTSCEFDFNAVTGGTGGANNVSVKAAGGEAAGGGLYLCGTGYDCASSIASFYGNQAQGGEGQPVGDTAGRSVYLCAGSGVLDEDGDGLPCWFEAEQGCDPEVTDASLWVSLEFPSPGASFRTLPIPLSGRTASPEVTPLFRSEDNGNTFADIGAPTSSLTWVDAWSPGASGAYDVVIRGLNGFGGSMDTEARKIHYQPSAPVVYITSPVHKRHVNGQVSVIGTASAGLAGFGGYTLEYRAGEDPEAAGAWMPVSAAPGAVTDSLLATWNVVALPVGWYVLRLRANDGAGLESTTWAAVYVDQDTTPPTAPEVLGIEGVSQPNLTSDNGDIIVSGQGDAACYLHLAELVNENGTAIKTVTSELTLHANGSLRGTCIMPGGSGASRVALRLSLRDGVGNIGLPATSNYLTVDNAPPSVSIAYLPDNAELYLNNISPETYTLHGTAADLGDSGVERVELRINGGSWLPVTGTTEWTHAWTPTIVGTYVLEARALDYQGNISATASVTVIVASDKPAAYILSPVSGSSYFTGTVVNIIGTAWDDMDFQDYQVQYKNAGDPDWTLITPVPVTLSVHEGLLVQWDTASLTSPEYLLQVVARDASANVSTHTISVGILADLSLSGIPDIAFYEGSQFYRYVYLPDFAVPRVGAEAHTYALAAPLPPAGMGVTIDGDKWLHILPETDWFGWADVMVSVDDGAGHVATDTFRVQITNVNDPPTAPGITLTPAQPDDGDELICEVSSHASDPDGDPFLYYFDWYRSTDGFDYGVVQRSVSQQVDLINGNRDSLSSLMTTPGDYWRCVVRAYDGYAFSATPATLAVRILYESSIMALVSPQSVTLGTPVTLSGKITGLSGIAPVGFTSVSPGGITDTLYPEGTVCNASGEYTRTFHPREATEGRSFWQLRAAWSGDAAYRGAESDAAFFSVMKAQPALTLAVSHSSALLLLQGTETFTVDASFYVPGFPGDPDLLALYDGVTVRLSVQTPDGQTPYAPLVKATSGAGHVSFTKADFDAAGILFDQAGLWRFKADFLGDDNFLPAATADYDLTDARLTIKEGAGYAILVLGRLDENAEGHAEHAQTADYVYSVLRERGLSDEDIFYLREFLPGEIDRGNPVDGAATAENLQVAIETWARDKMLASPAPLYVILADHGSPGLFHMDVGGTPAQEAVPAADLAQWLHVLEISLDTKAASEQEIVVIYGACYSGTFLPALSGPGRVIITSTAAEEISYRGVLNQDTGVRDGEFFLMELFRNLGAGRSLKQGFELACAKTSDYVNNRSNGGAGDVPQHPLLDDNGDGSGTTGQLSAVPGWDGAVVAGLDLGLGVNAGTGISWFNASPPKFIGVGESIGKVLAQTTGRAPEPGDTAWLEIKTPGYDSGETAAPGYEDFQRVAVMAGPIAPTELRDLGGGAWAYAWTQATLEGHPDFDGFTVPGTYKLYYFLRDGDTGQVGAYLITDIYVSQAGNMPPNPVALLYLPDGAIVHTRPLFAWNAAVDPEGDTVTYHLQISQDPGFDEASTLVFTTMATIYYVEEDRALQDLAQYYWRVVPVDSFGAHPVLHEVRSFTTDNANPEVPGVILGSVREGVTQAAIAGAALQVLPTGATTSTTATGEYFLGSLPQGLYALEVAAAGYDTAFIGNVTVQSGRFTVQDVLLTYAGGNRRPVLESIGSRQIVVGTTLTLQCNATDPDAGDVLTWSVLNAPPRMTIDAATGQLVYEPVEGDEGDHPIVVQVKDDGSPSLMAQEALTITVKGVNHAPVLEPIGSLELLAGERLEYQCLASDPDTGDILTWRLVNAPIRMGIDENSGQLVYEAIDGEEAVYTVTVEVTDNGLPPLIDSETITVTVKRINQPPVLEPVGSHEVLVGRRLDVPCQANDPDTGDTLTWVLLNPPPRMTINPVTGLLVYQPITGDEGTHMVTVQVWDNGDPPLYDEETVTITVLPGAYITGPPYVVIGEDVELVFHPIVQAEPWHVQWDHDGVVIPDQTDDLLVIEFVTWEDAGWYTAMQISDAKAEPVSASFYLNVVEAVPLRGWVALAIVALIAVMGCMGRIGRMGRIKRRRQE